MESLQSGITSINLGQTFPQGMKVDFDKLPYDAFMNIVNSLDNEEGVSNTFSNEEIKQFTLQSNEKGSHYIKAAIELLCKNLTDDKYRYVKDDISSFRTDDIKKSKNIREVKSSILLKETQLIDRLSRLDTQDLNKLLNSCLESSEGIETYKDIIPFIKEVINQTSELFDPLKFRSKIENAKKIEDSENKVNAVVSIFLPYVQRNLHLAPFFQTLKASVDNLFNSENEARSFETKMSIARFAQEDVEDRYDYFVSIWNGPGKSLEFVQLLHKIPSSEPIALEVAKFAFKEGDEGKALEAIKLSSENERGKVILSFCEQLLKEKKYDKIEEFLAYLPTQRSWDHSYETALQELLTKVIDEYIDLGKYDEAKKLVETIFSSGRDQTDDSRKVTQIKIFINMGTRLLLENNAITEGLEILKSILETEKEIHSFKAMSGIRSCVSLSKTLAERGQYDDALKCVNLIADIPSGIRSSVQPELKTSALNDIFMLLLARGFTEKALQVAESLDIGSSKDEAYRIISSRYAIHGDYPSAVKNAQIIQDKMKASVAFTYICKKICFRNDFELAKVVANSIEIDEDKEQVLNFIKEMEIPKKR